MFLGLSVLARRGALMPMLLTSDPAPAPDGPTGAVRFAAWIGRLGHPLVVAIPIGLAGAARELDETPVRLLGLAAATIAATAGPAAALIRLQAAREGVPPGRFLRDRRSRVRVYPAMALGFLLDWVLFATAAPFALGRAMALAALAVTAALYAANFVSKVSLHCAGNAGIVAGLLAVYGAPGLLLAPIVPLMVWARVATGNHTVGQALAGVAIGAAVGAAVVVQALPALRAAGAGGG